MSQTYDPNSPENGPEHGQGYASGPGWAGYASAPPPPPRRNHKRGLISPARSRWPRGPPRAG
jgi:hypothetical protein